MGVSSVDNLQTGHYQQALDALMGKYTARSLERIGCSMRALAVLTGNEEALEIWKANQFFTYDEGIKQPLDPLTPQQLDKLLAVAKRSKTLRDAVMIKTGISTGATVSEIIGVDRVDVDLPQGTENVTIRYGSKDSRKSRVSFIDEEGSLLAVQYLNMRTDTQPPFLISGIKNTSVDGRLTRQAINVALSKYNTAVGRDISPTNLRDSFIYSFKGSADELRAALGVSYTASYMLMSRKQHTKI